MARVALALHEQTTFLERVRRKLGITQAEIAGLCQAHPRTFSDWMRGKYRMKYESLQQLIRRARISVGRGVKSLPEFSHVRAAAHLGAMQRNRLYGNPGTPEGRRRGGLMSIKRKRATGKIGVLPDGFRLAKPIREPQFSPALAEFLGIMLGDGCLCSAFQAALYFNTETDALYADFMSALGQRLFGIVPRRVTERGSRGGTLLFSSKRLVDYLIRLGFGRGDKVRNQAGVPSWILEDRGYCRNCLRGLMDTDGSVYRYDHQVYGRTYVHMALCFTNRSYPLLRFVSETLASNGYHPVMTGFRIYLYRRTEIERYFSDVKTSNAKHLRRYQEYAQRLGTRPGRGARVVESAVLEKR